MEKKQVARARVSDRMYNELMAICERDQKTMSEVLREAIEFYIEKKGV